MKAFFERQPSAPKYMRIAGFASLSTALISLSAWKPIEDKKEPNKLSIKPKLLGAFMAGIFDVAILHPFDTWGKRLMACEHKIFEKDKSLNHNLKSLHKIIFQQPHLDKSFFPNFLISSYLGGIRAAQKKIPVSIYRFGVQSYIADYLKQNYSFSKVTAEAIAGLFIGFSETLFFYPLDHIKVKAQINSHIYKRSTADILIQEKFSNLYRGWSLAVLRNCAGAVTLFGTTEFFRGSQLSNNFYGVGPYFLGAFSSLFFSYPFDLLKTKIQKQPSFTGFNPINWKYIKNEIKRGKAGEVFYARFLPQLPFQTARLALGVGISKKAIAFLEKDSSSQQFSC